MLGPLQSAEEIARQSYRAAERVMFGDRPDIEKPNTAEGRERVTQLLRFSRSGERLTGMPLLTLFYPSITLAEMGDPLEWRRSAAAGPLLSHLDLLKSVADRLGPALAELSVLLCSMMRVPKPPARNVPSVWMPKRHAECLHQRPMPTISAARR